MAKKAWAVSVLKIGRIKSNKVDIMEVERGLWER